MSVGFPGGPVVKKSACQCRRPKRRRFDSWVRKIPWSRKRQLTPVLWHFQVVRFFTSKSGIYEAKGQPRTVIMSFFGTPGPWLVFCSLHISSLCLNDVEIQVYR